MLYRDITQVSVVGLRGTLYIEKTRDADGVLVQATGPYEAKAAGDAWLVICPEGYEPATPVPAAGAETPVTVEGTQVGSVDVTARVHSGARPAPRRRARASARAKGTVRITAPPGTGVELVGCRGVRKGPGGWRFMDRTCRFAIR
jgi:hypothetical protein